MDFYALIESNIIYTDVIVIVIVIKQCSPPPPERINSQPRPLDSAFATGQRSGSNALKMDSMQTTQSIPPIEADQYDVSSIHFHNNFKRVQSSASSSKLRLRLRTSPPTRTLHVADQCSVAANRRFGHLQNLFASLYFTASAKSFAAQFLPLVVLISDGGFSTWRRQTLWKMTEQKNSKRSVSLDGRKGYL